LGKGQDEREEDAMSRKHTAEFREKAAELARQSDSSIPQAARSLGCNPSAPRDWIERADAQETGSDPSSNPFEVQEEPRQLKKENARLKMDNEILLKASAFSASRNLQGQRRRRPGSPSWPSIGRPAPSLRCAGS
jgi:transposase